MAILPLLYRIQELESRVAELDRNLAALQQNPELEAIRSLQNELQGSLDRLETGLKKVKDGGRQLDLDLKSCQERLKNEENKLYGGSVVHPRELEQIQQRVTEYQERRNRIEEELLQLMEKEDKWSAGRLVLQQRAANAAQENERFEAEARRRSQEFDLEKEQLLMELEELTPQIPPEWLERYRKIAKSRRGIGIAKLKQNSCGACHVSLSDSRLNQVKRGEDKLQFCENCGRILFY
jgi:predicted  nucleic acid-binding Zn-ribbon protein